MNIMWAGVFLALGWLWFYLFIRQFLFNLMTAYPLLKQMNALDKELIAVGAKRYTHISTGVSAFFALAAADAVIAFCALYLKICFFIGGLVALVMFVPTLSYKHKPMFETFCGSYYRFVPDDELRTAIYNKKIPEIKRRLRAMGFSAEFVPQFDKKSKK